MHSPTPADWAMIAYCLHRQELSFSIMWTPIKETRFSNFGGNFMARLNQLRKVAVRIETKKPKVPKPRESPVTITHFQIFTWTRYLDEVKKINNESSCFWIECFLSVCFPSISKRSRHKWTMNKTLIFFQMWGCVKKVSRLKLYLQKKKNEQWIKR